MTEVIENNEESSQALVPVIQTKIDLHDVHAVRRELGAVYRDARNRKIETQDATRFGYLLNLILKAHESCGLQKQLDAIQGEIRKR